MLTGLSFRDPAGQVFRDGERVLRRVAPSHAQWVLRFLDGDFFRGLSGRGILPGTRRCAPPREHDGDALWLEHERIDCPAYPHEWIPDQLFAAGLLTIELALEAASAGLQLKDATPYNVLFSRGRPVFCDVLSFEDRGASELWFAYGQFQRNFVLPLYAYRRFGLPPHRLFLERRDGLEPAEIHAGVPWYRRALPFELQVITLPALLARSSRRADTAAATGSGTSSPRSDFVFRRSLQRLRSQLLAVRPRELGKTTWARYEDACTHYASEDRARKHEFVEEAVHAVKPGRVLDLGANAGEYSRIAAATGAHVIAADFDVEALQGLHRRNEREALPITPFVLNIGRPTPAVGWRNGEHAAFLERIRGQADLVLALAVIHHVLVSERVPLDDFIDFLADLQAGHLVLEWVSPEDPKFREIAGANAALYAHLDEAALRRSLERRFSVRTEAALSGGRRRLFLCDRKS